MATEHPGHEGRRVPERGPSQLASLRAGFWAAAGAIVVIYIFFAAIGGIDPGDAQAVTIIVLVLAVLWLAHSWRRLWGDQASLADRTDRERRGF